MTALAGACAAALRGGCGTLSALHRADDAVRPAGATAVVDPRADAVALMVANEPALTAVSESAVEADTAERPAPADSPAADEHPALHAESSAPPVLLEALADGMPEWFTDLESEGDIRSARDAEVVAQARDTAQPKDDTDEMGPEEYDPWEKFNEKTFEFNRRVDRYVLKPVATVYNKIMPEPFQVAISNGFDNIAFIPRMVNSALQGKWGGAGRELSRFLINSTAGIGGLFDPAKDYWGIRKSREDFGQTLGVWGAGPGPYVVVPFLEPLTVRDGIGKFVDLWMDPMAYFLPLIWTRLGLKVGDIVNDRSLNLELFQGFVESVIDLYSAVRHGYLQRRENLIKE